MSSIVVCLTHLIVVFLMTTWCSQKRLHLGIKGKKVKVTRPDLPSITKQISSFRSTAARASGVHIWFKPNTRLRQVMTTRWQILGNVPARVHTPVAFDIYQGWGQIRFIKYKYKYKYKNLDFSNTNTNTNILLKFDSNTNTNTNTSIQIQIPIRSIKYICRKLFGSKIGQFYKSQDKCSWSVFPPNI